MSVYFVTCRQANAVKIGSSHDPHWRTREIQWGCPLPVVLEAVMPGSQEEEFALHRRFADDNLTGEWFAITPVIEMLIEANPPPAPPTPKVDTRYRPPRFGDETLTGRVRARLRITQIELASLLGVSREVVFKLEQRRKKPTPPDIKEKLEELERDAIDAQLARLGPKAGAA